VTVTVTSFVATVPAGTTHTVALNVGTNDVIRIRWRVPPGPRGNLSWYLAMGGVQVLPGTMGTAIVADDESDVWEIGDLPDSGAWQLIGTNTGSFDHSVYLQFFTEPVGQGGTTGGNILDGFPVSDADLPGLFLT
jgi:hypothetical protein